MKDQELIDIELVDNAFNDLLSSIEFKTDRSDKDLIQRAFQ